MAQNKTTSKKATKNSTGKTRAEQSKELFTNIREYNLLGFRIGDGLYNMFSTLVTAISKDTMSVVPDYNRYTVSTEDGAATFRFVINVGKRRYTVHAQANRQPRKSRIVLEGFGPYPFSENGVRKIVKTLKEIK
jgi:hypothetical protein